jgi:hypothetical protein
MTKKDAASGAAMMRNKNVAASPKLKLTGTCKK